MPDFDEVPEYPAGYEWMLEGPPWWYAVVNTPLQALVRLVFALLVMEQWAVWLLVTLNIYLPWAPWTMAIGVVVIAAQMLALFETRQRGGPSCPVPGPD